MFLAFKFPDPTGFINFFVKVLEGLIGVVTFFFGIPLLMIAIFVVFGGFYLYAKSKKQG